jgi:hypothetical protein
VGHRPTDFQRSAHLPFNPDHMGTVSAPQRRSGADREYAMARVLPTLLRRSEPVRLPPLMPVRRSEVVASLHVIKLVTELKPSSADYAEHSTGLVTKPCR